MRKIPRERITIIIVFFLIALICIWALISPNSYKVTDGIYTIDLLGFCQFDVYDTTILPEVTIVYRCPRVDAIKIWPLPVESPFQGEIEEHINE